MWLARDEQDAQLVAHAVDGDDGAIVDRRQFAVERRRLDLEDVGAGVRDLHLDAVGKTPGVTVRCSKSSPSRADLDLGGAAAAAGILDPEGDGLLLADDAEARRRDQDDAAVALVGDAGDQRMQAAPRSRGQPGRERRGRGRR